MVYNIYPVREKSERLPNIFRTKVATRVEQTDDEEGNKYTSVYYHSTPVVSFNEKKIILKTGGYSTMTTKARMNQASGEYGLNYQVYQDKFNWYVKHNGKVIPFKGDTLVLER